VKIIIEPYFVASLQFNPQLHEVESNIQRLIKMVEQAAYGGAKLIVSPEMGITGYHLRDREEVARYSDTVPGAVTSIFVKLAVQYKCYIVIGLPELDLPSGLYYNTAALVGPDGYIGKYRKIHLWEAEMHWSAWGNLEMPIFNTPIGRLGMAICMDAYFFETFRLAAVKGADVVAFLTNSTGGSLANLQARALENGQYVVCANRSDQERDYSMVGNSSVWDPLGKLLVVGGRTDEEIVKTTIDPQRYQTRRKLLLKRRRPELYHDLALHISPWNSRQNEKSLEVMVACCQYKPDLSDKEGNIQSVKRLLQEGWYGTEAREQKLDLLVLPELSFCGSPTHIDSERAWDLAERIDPLGIQGPSMKYVTGLAKDLNTNIVFGLIERDEERLYNSAVMIGRNGMIIGTYRKTHLSDSDSTWATAGSSFTVIPVEGLGNVGLAIGSEAESPEVFALLAIKRADLVVLPSSCTRSEGEWVKVSPSIHPDSGKAMVYWDIRARENCFYLIVADYTGGESDYIGGSGVYGIDPVYGLDQSNFLGTSVEGVMVTSFRTLPKNWYTQERFLACRRADGTYNPLFSLFSDQTGL